MRRVIEVLACSIIETGADAVVNASNPDAVLGGGVSRALFDECGGEVLQREMKEKLEAEFDDELEPDDCLVTSGGTSARVKFVLHVASVDYRTQGTTSSERVTSAAEAAVRRAIEVATSAAPISLAFPLLGAGSGGLSPGLSLKAMGDGMRRVFREDPDAPISRVVFAVPDAALAVGMKKRLETLLITG